MKRQKSLPPFKRSHLMHKTIGLGTFEATQLTYELVSQVLDSGRISYGPLSKKLESDFANLHGCDYGVLSNSGTSSLQVALQALKELHRWEDWTKVIVPAVTFVATVNIVFHNKMWPVLVDVDPATYNMDINTLLPQDKDAKCIIPVHLFGQPANMTEIGDLAARHNMLIIEDSCETMFATHGRRSVGSIGDIGCFSFYMAHLITAGVGGVSITNNPDYAAKMRSLVNHGRDGIYISIDDDDVANKEEVMGRRFNFESVGHSFRVTELEAAIALAQLETWEAMIAKRRANALVLDRALEDVLEVVTPYVAPGNTHSYMMYPIIMNFGDKWEVCAHLENNGVETREMLPITNQPVYRNLMQLQETVFPVANLINDTGFYVGCHQGLEEDDMLRIADLIKEYFDK